MSINASSFLVLACTLAHLAGTVQAAQPATAEPAPTTPAKSTVDELAVKPTDTLAEALAKMPEWTVLIEVSAYRVGASGKVSMPGSSALASPPSQGSLKLEQIGADAAQWAPYGRLRWRPNQGNWSFGISSFGTNIDETGTAVEDQRVGDMLIQTGDAIATDIKFLNADLEAGYRIFERPLGRGASYDSRIAPYLDLIGGIRIIDTDVKFTHQSNSTALPAPGQQFQASEHDVFVQPVIGARAGLEIVEKFNIDLKFTTGYWPGDTNSLTWDIEPCFTWRPIKNVGVHIGYRNMFMDLQSGKDEQKYEWNGTLAGLYFGITGRF